MAEKTMNKVGVTKVGVASWAKINNKVDIYENNGKIKRTYQVQLHFPNQADEDAMKAEIEKVFEEFKAHPDNKGKTFDKRYPASLGFYEDKDGKTQFKFWTFSEYPATDTKPETKKIVDVAVFGEGPLGDRSIGNGSLVQVKYSLSPFWASAKTFGVSLNMVKVLVRELVEYGGEGNNDWSEFGDDVNASMPVTKTVEESQDEEFPY